MSDRPQQQLAEVITRVIPTLDLVSDPPEVLAAAIVAAVNSGDIDPLVPDVTEYVTEYVSIPRDELKWLLSCKTSDSDKVEAELASLRALKARLDGAETAYRDRVPAAFVAPADGVLAWTYGWRSCLAWLRGTDP